MFRYFLLSLLALNCYGPSERYLNHAERQYLAEAKRQPLNFYVDSIDRSVILDRAHRFLWDHCALKLQISDDRLIETYNPVKLEYAYTILVNEEPPGIRCKVKCQSPIRGDIVELQNAHVAAYAIATGRMPSRNLVYQRLDETPGFQDGVEVLTVLGGVLAFAALLYYAVSQSGI